jgi:hypothetical protein
MMNDILTYYATPGVFTAPGEHAALFHALAPDLNALVAAVQGAMVHIFWAERYGLDLSDERKAEVQLRDVERMLARYRALNDGDLAMPRPPEQRLVGNCRDHSVLLAAMLRHCGLPARARCGFGAYFGAGHYGDHWVAEVWDAGAGRWKLVDAQLDELQRGALQIGFDTHDVPRDQLIVGGQAWRMCRQEGADPERFGIFDMHGLWFIADNVLRDVLALNKVELLPWDGWSVFADPRGLSAEYLGWVDELAELSLAADDRYADVRAACAPGGPLAVPPDWPPAG